MPHPLLLSNSLYAVPSLPQQLEALGYIPGATGYDKLKDTYGPRVNVPTPHVRTVQKMFKGELVKYVMCDGIIRLLNMARSENGLDLLTGALIEEHEYYIDNLEPVLATIKRQSGKVRGILCQEISQHTGKHSGLIKSLMKKRRTTQERCLVVKDAIVTLYGKECLVTNAPFIVKPGKSSRATKPLARKDR